MRERIRLINKIHQTEDKISSCENFISRYGKDAYGYKETSKKLVNYKKELERLQEELRLFPELEDVPALKEFLDRYKKATLSWIEAGYERYKDLQEQYNREFEIYRKSHSLSGYSYKARKEFDEEHRKLNEELKECREPFVLYLNRFQLVERDVEIKYIDLLEKVKDITGRINDAGCLRINPKGELDGFITGEKGTAKINTFGAGGYNIQRYHYRTKVTPVKEK